MTNTKTALIILALVVIAAIAFMVYKAYAPSIAPENNQNVTLTNSSTLNYYNGTNSNSSLSNSTLNGNVSQDQNYSVLSNANIISSP